MKWSESNNIFVNREKKFLYLREIETYFNESNIIALSFALVPNIEEDEEELRLVLKQLFFFNCYVGEQDCYHWP